MDACKVIMGRGAAALRQAAEAGLIARDIEDDVIRVTAENERLEHDNRMLRGVQGRQAAQISEYRQMVLARTGWQVDGKSLRRARKDERAGLMIIGITIGCVVTAFLFCGVVYGGWFA